MSRPTTWIPMAIYASACSVGILTMALMQYPIFPAILRFISR